MSGFHSGTLYVTVPSISFDDPPEMSSSPAAIFRCACTDFAPASSTDGFSVCIGPVCTMGPPSPPIKHPEIPNANNNAVADSAGRLIELNDRFVILIYPRKIAIAFEPAVLRLSPAMRSQIRLIQTCAFPPSRFASIGDNKSACIAERETVNRAVSRAAVRFDLKRPARPKKQQQRADRSAGHQHVAQAKRPESARLAIRACSGQVTDDHRRKHGANHHAEPDGNRERLHAI